MLPLAPPYAKHNLSKGCLEVKGNQKRPHTKCETEWCWGRALKEHVRAWLGGPKQELKTAAPPRTWNRDLIAAKVNKTCDNNVTCQNPVCSLDIHSC